MAKQTKKPATSAKKSTSAKKGDAPEEAVNEALLLVGKQEIKGVQFGDVVSASDSGEEADDAGIMSAGYAPLNEAGYILNAIFNGRKRIFSPKFADSKAKKTLSYNGEEHLYRDVLVFTDAAGKSFSIFLTGILGNLTRALPRDTAVKLTYKGTEKITEGTYEGNDQHMFDLQYDRKADKIVAANQYKKGCHNWLNNPMEPRAKDTTPKAMADLNNYMNAVRTGEIVVSDAEKIALLGGSDSLQIAQ
jgi:hypothetical protein